MKRFTFLAVALLFPAFLHAEMKPLENLEAISNAFIVKGRVGELSIEPGAEAVIRYTPDLGQSNVLVFGQGKEAMETDVKEISVDFLVHGYGSIGIYVAGNVAEAAADGYLALANTERNNQGQLRIIRNPIWPQAYPKPEEIKAKQGLKSYRADNWFRLTLTLEPRNGDEVLITARITDPADGSVVSEVQYADEHGMQGSGNLALRLFGEKEHESFVEFKNIVITPRD